MGGFAISLETAYGSLTLFTSILHNVFLLYHVNMFVSVYQISKTSFWLGEVIFLIWNSLNDPLFGWFSDQKLLGLTGSESKHSRDIVWMRLKKLHIYCPLFALAFCLFWIDWTYPGVQFAICLCLYDGFLTMIDLHHSALLADLSISVDARTKLNSRCSIFSAMGSISVFLSYLVWNKSDLKAFRLFCGGLALFSFLGYLVMVRSLKKAYTKRTKDAAVSDGSEDCESEDINLSTSQTNVSVAKFGCQLLSHQNFLWFSVLNLIQVFHCHFNSNFFPLFLDALLGESVSPAVSSLLLGASFVAPHLNNLYFLSLARRYGVYVLVKALLLVKLGLSLVMWQIGPGSVWMLCIFISSNRIFTEGTCKLLSLVISDLVDEDAVLHNRPVPVSALIFGTAALLSKPGQTLAPLIGTWILSLQTGHDIFRSGIESGSIKVDLSLMEIGAQDAHRKGVFFILVFVPVACALMQLLAWWQFTLKGHRLAQIKTSREGLKHVQIF
ncbi:transmembrane protein 180-like [Plakobranchus ocellatus]|uniref:Transmembrane protein 180-like n=1 Tax=Plakobranchus ocellatus TaxID=259542 RepID=A0AAV4DKW0_9GAST|nr:transmembrane protein 180-like [Plakobranchus ocellatus]